jgi:anaerobic magnesium-protoporphyrin IX monomethyl ester cyclase
MKKKVILFFPDQEVEFNWPPFSYMTLAPILKNAGFDPIVIDQRVQKNWRELIDRNINDSLWIGMSVMIGPAIMNSLKVVEYIKEQKKCEIPVVYGGWWPTVAQRITLNHPYVDYIAIGPGDEVIVPLSNYFLGINKELPSSVLSKSQINKANDSTELIRQVVPSKKSQWKEAYSLIPDLEFYRSKNNVMALFGAMSCPYARCKFCCIVQHYKYIMRDPEDILDEISFLINEKKFTSIVFLDGLFLTGPKSMELIQGFKKRGFKMEWKCKLRSDSLSKLSSDEINLLKETGLRVISCGFESGSDRMLAKMDKGVKAEDAYKTAKICKDFGLELQATYLFGMPGENVDDLKKSIEHIEKLSTITDKFYYSNFFYVPTPGTHAFNEFVQTGGEVPSTLEEWSYLLWQNSPGAGINKMHWLAENERQEYTKIFNDYFKNTVAKKRISWRHE